jgi:hypothetical protein
MSVLMQRVLSGKRESRRQLAAMPFAQKLALLEKLRDRSLLIGSGPLRQSSARRARLINTGLGSAKDQAPAVAR